MRRVCAVWQAGEIYVQMHNRFRAFVLLVPTFIVFAWMCSAPLILSAQKQSACVGFSSTQMAGAALYATTFIGFRPLIAAMVSRSLCLVDTVTSSGTVSPFEYRSRKSHSLTRLVVHCAASKAMLEDSLGDKLGMGDVRHRCYIINTSP